LALGLSGVCIMVGPHLQLAGPTLQAHDTLGALFALSAALSAAVAMIFLRSMSHDEHAITITFYFMLTSMLCALATIPWGWVAPNQQQTIALLLLGLFGVFGQLLLTYSYRYAEASTIAPLDYTNMIMSVTLGYWIFDELPSWSIWAGVPLVIASGLIIFWREYRLQQHHRRQLALVAE
jgi:drug/metabolite transporter (DMT)-like permease